jgi:hypothetical protein
MTPRQVGGSFAPPLDDAKMGAYRAAVAQQSAGPVKDALAALLACCARWWDLPEPQGTRTWDHPSGRGAVVGLEEAHARELDDLIPWAHELDAMQTLFEGIDAAQNKPLRDIAFHLLWHVKELDRGREPLTSDKL